MAQAPVRALALAVLASAMVARAEPPTPVDREDAQVTGRWRSRLSPLVPMGAVGLTLGGAGAAVGVVIFVAEVLLANALPVFPPAQPTHVASALTWVASGALLIAGGVMLGVGNAQSDRDQRRSAWSPSIGVGLGRATLTWRF